jgi:4-amino-4-deoxy-L-arabinose transferase-like glycosyltransferase
MKKYKTYYLFTITIILIILIPSFVQDGMFFDGVTYSAISKNLANGLGSIWEPHYTKVLYPYFHEHPPLVFVLQSIFFKIFGNAFYTEKIYCLITTFITILGISKCWRLVVDHNEQKQYDWLPILIWITIPLVSWSSQNNMLENTMTVFTTFAVFCILKAMIENKIIYLIIGSILVILAFLSKGIVGSFPIIIPLIYLIVYKKTNSIFYFSYLLVFFSIISFVILFAFPELKNNLILYFNQQLLPAINNKREITTNNRFSILVNLIIEISLPILIFGFVFIKQRKSKSFYQNINKTALLFFLIALSASIPLILTLKQRNFYLIPSVPFYVLSISLYSYPFFISKIENKISPFLMRIKQLSIILLIGVFIFSIFKFGEISRDKDKLNDVYLLCRYLPEGTILKTKSMLWSDWELVAYLSRIGYLSLDCDNDHEFLLIEKNDRELIEQYNNIDLGLNKYKLMRKK